MSSASDAWLGMGQQITRKTCHCSSLEVRRSLDRDPLRGSRQRRSGRADPRTPERELVRQERELLATGYRVIATTVAASAAQSADRRLRHDTSRPTNATRASRPERQRLVGFSMGTGEVTRHLGATDRHGCVRRRCSVRSRRTCGRRGQPGRRDGEVRADQGRDRQDRYAWFKDSSTTSPTPTR